MKVRTRSSKKVKDRVNVWPSFVDIMSTIALVFFFIMVFSLAMFTRINEQTDNIVKERHELYQEIKNQLEPTLGDDVVYEEGILQIKSSLLFDTDSAKLSKTGKKVAKDIGDAFINILKNPKYEDKIDAIKIVGHTDCDYDAQYNRTLSTKRSVAFVNQMLNDKNEDSEYGAYFEASGMSKYTPKEGQGTVEEQTPEQKEQNRRIEIKIVFSDSDIAKLISENLKDLLSKGK